MNKAYLLQEIVAYLLAQSESIKESSEKAREASVEAPGARQSRSDTTKSEMGWLSQKLTASSVETRKQVESLQKINLSPSDYICEGSLVRLRDKEGDAPQNYFVLSCGSGVRVKSQEGEKVVVVTPGSPIGTALVGKRKGDTCIIQIPSGVREVVIDSIE